MLKFLSRWSLVLIFFVLVGAMAVLTPEDLGLNVDLSIVQQEEEPVDQIMRGVHLIETTGGSNEWELWADEALSFKGKGSWDVQKVKVTFYSEDGIEFRTRGKRGVVRVNSKDMLIEGDVVTKTSNDYQFYTDAVVYSSARRELSTAHPVKIRGPKDLKNERMTLRGVGLHAEMQNSQIHLHEKVKGEQVMDSGGRMKIRSQRAKMSGHSRQATFTGDVEMFVDTLTVTGPQAVFTYDDEEKLLDTIEVSGGVRVSDENKWATSETLDISVPQNKYVLNGSPRVVQNNDEIEGEQIVLLNGGKQVQVFSGKASLTEQSPEQDL